MVLVAPPVEPGVHCGVVVCSGRLFHRASGTARPYGGLPLKVIWAVFDLVAIGVLITGIFLWLKK